MSRRSSPSSCLPSPVRRPSTSSRWRRHARIPLRPGARSRGRRSGSTDPARLAVAGDSAGGNLAAGVARLAAADGGTAPAFQLLFYPWLDLSSKRQSYRLFGDGFFLTEAGIDWYAGHYLTDASDARDP